MTDFGHIPEPDYFDDDLYETVGYVERIWVEQESGRDAFFFLLAIYARGRASGFHDPTVAPFRYQKFFVYLDIGTTVAMGQLQLLRDAIWSRQVSSRPPLLVRVHFNFKDATQNYAFAYWVGINLVDTYPVVVEEFYQEEITSRWPGGWYAHLADEE